MQNIIINIEYQGLHKRKQAFILIFSLQIILCHIHDAWKPNIQNTHRQYESWLEDSISIRVKPKLSITPQTL